MSQDFGQFKETVKERADIAQIIGSYLQLKKQGSRYLAVCPFHNDHKPSMNVTPQMGIYRCFVCGASGDVFSFLQEYEKLSFMEALKLVAEKVGLEMPRQFEKGEGDSGELKDLMFKANALAADFYQQELKKSGPAMEYIKKRGISPESQKKFQLGFAPSSWDAFYRYALSKGFKQDLLIKGGLIKLGNGNRPMDRFVNRLIFPIWNLSHKIVGFGGRGLEPDSVPKYLNSPETMLYQKSHILYGLNFARLSLKKAEELILVEGYMDVIALHQFGLENSISVSGTALTDQHVKRIRSFAQRVYLCLDGDNAGQRAAEKSLPMLMSAGIEVKIPDLPSEHDPDSYCRQFGVEGFKELLEKSKGPVEFLLREYLKKPDSFSPEQKDMVYKQATGVISNSPSEIVRAEYQLQIRKLLGISANLESRPQIQKTQTPVSKNFPAANLQKRVADKVKRDIEWKFLQILISEPKLYPEISDSIHLEWFQDQFLQELLDRFFFYLSNQESYHIKGLLEVLLENQKLAVENMEILEISNFSTTLQEIKDIISELGRRYYRRSMREITIQIRENKMDKSEGRQELLRLQKEMESI